MGMDRVCYAVFSFGHMVIPYFFHNVLYTKMHIKYRLRNGGHFVQGEMSSRLSDV